MKFCKHGRKDVDEHECEYEKFFNFEFTRKGSGERNSINDNS